MMTCPGAEWERMSPAEAGADLEEPAAARQWLDDHVGGGRYRIVIVRGGRLAGLRSQAVKSFQALERSRAAATR
jgi:hypothetical protein